MKKPEENQGFDGIQTRDLCNTLYQLSYEATHWERGQLIEFISSREKLMSNSLGQVDFAVGLVDYVLHLPNRQMKLFWVTSEID